MKFVAILITLILSISVAEARPRHHRHRVAVPAPVEQCFLFFCKTAPFSYTAEAAEVAHPSGCPARAFCGCGAAVEIFGHPVRNLWLAANWFQFPRANPAPNTVAVRRHHVFVLKEHRGGDIWLVKDYNSGGHRSRLHERSIAGYTIVQPHG